MPPSQTGPALDASMIEPPERAATVAADLERRGYAGIWGAEGAWSPYVPLAVAAGATTTPLLGTAVAMAFPRSPYVTAQTAWELQALSGGRFVLGLGTQVRRHVERRFSVPFTPPGPRLRECVLAIRELWAAFREERGPEFRGEYYTHDLSAPTFQPPPLAWPDPPIHVAAINPWMWRMAGEVADGIVAHPFHSPAYFDEVVGPALEEGLARSGRRRADLTVTARVFLIPTDDPAVERDLVALARQRIGFYGSTPAYRRILDVHGWADAADELQARARARRWDDLAEVVDDAMVEAYCSIGTWAELPGIVRARYGDRLDRIMAYDGFGPPPDVEPTFVAAFNT